MSLLMSPGPRCKWEGLELLRKTFLFHQFYLSQKGPVSTNCFQSWYLGSSQRGLLNLFRECLLLSSDLLTCLFRHSQGLGSYSSSFPKCKHTHMLYLWLQALPFVWTKCWYWQVILEYTLGVCCSDAAKKVKPPYPHMSSISEILFSHHFPMQRLFQSV